MEHNVDLMIEKKEVIEMALRVGNELGSKDEKGDVCFKYLSNNKIASHIYCPKIGMYFPLNVNLSDGLTEWLVAIPIPETDNDGKKRLSETIHEINKGFNQNCQVLTFALLEDGQTILGRLAYTDESSTQAASLHSFTVVMFTYIIENVQRFWPFFLRAIDGSEKGDLASLIKLASERAVQDMDSNTDPHEGRTFERTSNKPKSGCFVSLLSLVFILLPFKFAILKD